MMFLPDIGVNKYIRYTSSIFIDNAIPAREPKLFYDVRLISTSNREILTKIKLYKIITRTYLINQTLTNATIELFNDMLIYAFV